MENGKNGEDNTNENTNPEVNSTDNTSENNESTETTDSTDATDTTKVGAENNENIETVTAETTTTPDPTVEAEVKDETSKGPQKEPANKEKDPKIVKTGEETRIEKNKDLIINDPAKQRNLAAEAAKAELANRATALGLDPAIATQQDVEKAEWDIVVAKNDAENARQTELKAKNHKLWVLELHINSGFKARAQTNLPPLTEAEVKTLAGDAGKSIAMEFVYTDDKQNLGHIVLREHDAETRCPIEGEYPFSVDYAAKAKADVLKANKPNAVKQDKII